MSLFVSETLPTTSADAIREFNERYLAGLSAAPVPTWASEFGDVGDTSSPDVTYPVGMLAGKYQETKGDSRFSTLEEREIRVKVSEFDIGYEAKLMDLQTKVYAYRKWNETPALFLRQEERHINRNIVGLLENAALTTAWDGLAFFHATHLANGTAASGGTFGNLDTVPSDPTDIADLTEQVIAFQSVKDENGEKFGASPTDILLPTNAYQHVVNVLAQQQLISENGAGVTNPFLGKFNLVHVPELNDQGTWHWYMVDRNLIRNSGVPPWGALKFRPSADLGLRFWDENSDFFKDNSRIKVSSHVWHGFALLFPHGIRKIVGTLGA